MAEDIALPLGTMVAQLGIGGMTGFLAGYAIKKIASILIKLASFALGLFVLALSYLSYVGIIAVNYEALQKAVYRGLLSTTLLGGALASSLANILPLSGSFAVGFYLGIKR